MNTHRLGIVVPHTHWDRAWYLPFQAYRLRLVEMMSEVLDALESGVLPLFVFDGQTVLLEDYFAVRPQDKPRVRALVEAGKMKLGPWYTMPDCFLATPESLIRNLQRGLQMAEDLGGASRVGYVPDSFGHFAQLPQILAGFGIDSFLFMRGMPARLRDESGAIFTWRAPNGAPVLATFLREGYFPLGALGQESFHGRYDGLEASAERARERLSHTLARVLPMQKESVVVLPAGGDHLPARTDLAQVVEQLNQTQNEIKLRFGSFEDYLNELRASPEHQAVPEYCGDLLGQADHPLLRNVLSSRVDLKILNHRAQSLLTGVVEPLLAWSKINGLPCVDQSLVQIAWDALLKNHAHDDICGCSVDEVHLDDVQRFHEVLALGQEIITRQVEHIVQHRLSPLKNSRSARVFAFNPHPWPVTVARKIQILLPDEGGEFSEPSPARTLQALNSAGQSLTVRVLSSTCKSIRNRYLETTWGRAYDVHAEFTVPPLGFEILTFSETQEPLDAEKLPRPANASAHSTASVAVRGSRPAVPPELLNAFRFELDADLGDGYSFGPCPDIPTQRAQLLTAHTDAHIDGVFHLSFEISGPEWIRRDDLATRPLSECVGPQKNMTLCVRAQVRKKQVWELQVSYTNVFSDSRLRIVFDPQVISGPAELGVCNEVLAHGQAQWVSVPARVAETDLWDGLLAKPTYPGEKPYPVHHTNDGVLWAGSSCSAFCGGSGVHEFELVDSLTSKIPAVALTLHRAVGFLSVRGGRIRSCQAGPQRPTPDAQMQKQIDHTLAFGTAENPAQAMRALKETLNPCWIQECPVVPVLSAAKSDLLSASQLDIGDTPLEVMSLRPVGTGILLRLLNPSQEHVPVALKLSMFTAGKFEATRVSLDEVEVVSKEEIVSQKILNTNFKPYEIQTWKIEPC